MSHRYSDESPDWVPCVDSLCVLTLDSGSESALFVLHPILAKCQHVSHHVEQVDHLAIWLVHHLHQHLLEFWIDDRYLVHWWYHWVYGAGTIHHFRVSIISIKLRLKMVSLRGWKGKWRVFSKWLSRKIRYGHPTHNLDFHILGPMDYMVPILPVVLVVFVLFVLLLAPPMTHSLVVPGQILFSSFSKFWDFKITLRHNRVDLWLTILSK